MKLSIAQPKIEIAQTNSRHHYAHPPIVEAIINIQVEVDEPCSLKSIEAYGKSISGKYPVLRNSWEGRADVTLTPDMMSDTKSDFQVVGYQLETETEPKRVLQLHPDSFTLSWMVPYDCWEVFRDEAKSLWQDFWPLIQPTAIRRVAVRYINMINIETSPGNHIEIGNYFSIFPQIPRTANLQHFQVSQYVLQVQMPQPDINSLLIINQAIGPTAKENILTVHLDLDVFSEQGWKQDHEAAWCFLEQLHNRSNQSFESFITDKTRELFK